MPVEWVTFDCYGTLIDWERGITDALLPLLPAGTDRRALAEWYISMEAQFEQEGYHLYKDVLDGVGRRVLRSLDAPLPDDKTSPLPSSLADWQPFPQAPTALRALVDHGRYLAILSHVERHLLDRWTGHLGHRPDLLLVSLTFAAGAVDAVVCLRLDVFTAVMTGNIVLLGLAIGQGAFRNALRSLIALLAYSVGVVAGARIVDTIAIESHWSPKVTRALVTEWVLQVGFFVGWLLSGANPDGVGPATLIAGSGVSIGIQAAAVRALAPGMSTTYVTGTLTGLLSELSALGTVSGDRRRRASIVVALALGAVAGALTLTTLPLLAPAIPAAVVGVVVLVAISRFR